MALNLDHPAGFTSRKHPSGMRIYAYADQPGGFVDEKGRPVSHKLAAEAGYDVAALILERDKNSRLAEFRRELDLEYSKKADELAAVAALCGDGIEVKPLKQGGYEVRRDGDKVHTKPLEFEAAKRMVEGLRGDEDEAEGTTIAAPAAVAGGKARGSQGAASSPTGAVSDLM